MSLELVPIDLDEAHAFCDRVHRHHNASVGGKFAVGVASDGTVVGVAVVGRRTARMAADTWTAEVTRVATDGTPNACSMLYAAAWRAVRALGYRKLVTYTLVSEPGTSLRAAGWRCIGQTKGGTWSRRERPRVDKHPLEPKFIWEAVA